MAKNLMTNAVKFTPDGGSVRFELAAHGEESELRFIDNGVGIADEDQAMLFTKFFRPASSFDAAVQGAGLGLTIVQAIVALHGGTVSVSSAEGLGTTVTVNLPSTAVSVTSAAAVAGRTIESVVV
jgi:signal transduction histidine kinase